MFFDSATKVAVLLGAPSDLPQDWMPSNEAIRDARDRVNGFAGSQRMLGHSIFTPGQDGWLDAIHHGISLLKPAGWKGYTIGDNTHEEISRYSWLMDDERSPTRATRNSIRPAFASSRCIKGCSRRATRQRFPASPAMPRSTMSGRRQRTGRSSNFLIYHAGYRYTGDNNPALAAKQFDETGRMDWVSDLAEAPAKYGASNVYADVGASFAANCLSQPRGAAAMTGILIKGLGADLVLWGTDSL
jgi:hypothetical protein